ncbi:alpha/beta hydrolase [Pseudomonas panipatensis]|uniref:Serine aminopeptidase S33 domain-containing protein n=1 Tax=Pseudomonas panipatensis TaxID=428992 RepID=A0A1G8L4P8_9PSED|nr:alpha/beta hydrolase [Pseudomonas panipatensis]SDI50652.1 hypothetical protein SAMN05216272_110152 [Pseudomonas panipatensis]SMP72492.1 hypothetical protein SAMN06295951_11118 [Pseudomonas panipatensis]
MVQQERGLHFIQGAAGRIQLTLDLPVGAARGIALISHPQPLLGGSPRHPLPTALARRLRNAGWIAVRPSFRGVEGSEGEYDAGVGEAEDSLRVVRAMRDSHPGLPVALVGFSFGAYVYARTACALEHEQAVEAIVLMGMPVGIVAAGREYPGMPVPQRALVIHGEADDIAPLSNLLDWARPDARPVLLYPGANHFFRGCLDRVIDTVELHLAQATSVVDTSA